MCARRRAASYRLSVTPTRALTESTELGKKGHTRRYTKRQFTFARHQLPQYSAGLPLKLRLRGDLSATVVKATEFN